MILATAIVIALLIIPILLIIHRDQRKIQAHYRLEIQRHIERIKTLTHGQR